MSQALLSVEGLSLNHGPQTVVQDLSFSLERGAYLALVGPNGGGKTSLLRALAGLHPPARGSIRWERGPRGLPSLGYLPQKVSQSDSLFPASVEEIVALGLHPAPPGLDRTALARRVSAIMEELGIASLRQRRVGLLSGGQQQRVHLARALVADPEVLLLDEPTSALAPDVRADFYALLQARHRGGATIILVSHDVGAMENAASQLLVLDRRPQFFGTSADFAASPAHALYHTEHSHGAD